MRQSERELLQFIRKKLPPWYRRHSRDLPWRRTRDPYAVWVSEIMLQQTRVATVVPYFQRWLRRFPDVRSLAAAPEADVLKAWEGLGYYSRARNLQKAARQVVERFGGELPRRTEQLGALAGIGPYTAGAIASIAFGADEPVLDGNVERVLCRVFRIASDPKSAATRKRLWALARRLIPRGRAGRERPCLLAGPKRRGQTPFLQSEKRCQTPPCQKTRSLTAGLFNQALMDLGATVCAPRSPRCPACPLRAGCVAAARGEQESLPRKRPRRAVPHFEELAAAIRKGGRILIARRPAEGLLGGLWELPGGRPLDGEPPAEALRRLLAERLGIEVAVGGPLAVVRHAYSHFRITLRAMAAAHRRGRARPLGYAACRWVDVSRLDEPAFGAAHRRVLGALGLGG